MPDFYYEAYLENGKVERNTINARNRQAAQAALASSGKHAFVLRTGDEPGMAAAGRSSKAKTAKSDPDQLDGVFGNLSVLLNSGFTIDQALGAMVEETGSKKQRALIEQLLRSLKEGNSVNAAFIGAGLSGEKAALLSAGESSGRLAQVFKAISARNETAAKRKSEIREALFYPAFLIMMMFAVIGVLAFYLVPAIEPIFEAADASRPTVIAFLSSLRNLLTSNGVVLLTATALVVLLVVMSPSFRRALSSLTFRFPALGRFLIDTMVAHYLRSLELLLANGVTVKEAMGLASQTVSNTAIRRQFDVAEEAVTSGSSLNRALGETRLLSAGLIAHIRIGEETNNLSAMLARCAALIEHRQKTTINRVMQFLTPAITIGLGLLIGTLVISVMSTLLSINEMAIR